MQFAVEKIADVNFVMMHSGSNCKNPFENGMNVYQNTCERLEVNLLILLEREK